MEGGLLALVGQVVGRGSSLRFQSLHPSRPLSFASPARLLVFVLLGSPIHIDDTTRPHLELLGPVNHALRLPD